MNVVDSSGWLEYFTDGPNAAVFAPVIEDTKHLLVPVICLYEVFKRIYKTQGQAIAEIHAADMHKGTLLDVTPSLAMTAAILSADLELPMADSLILATAREYGATLWTQDSHFEGIEGVQYIPKPPASRLP